MVYWKNVNKSTAETHIDALTGLSAIRLSYASDRYTPADRHQSFQCFLRYETTSDIASRMIIMRMM